MADKGSPGEVVNPTGLDWLGKFLEAQGKVMFQSQWMTFAIGQTGAVMHLDPQRARAMVEQMKRDAADLNDAMDELTGVVTDMLVNAERNLAATGT